MINSKQAKKYCSEPLELIEGYEAAISDYTQVWDLHHRGEVLLCGIFSIADLKKFNLYWNRPASELIFMTHSQHSSLHNKASRFGEIWGKIGGKLTGPKNIKIMHAKTTREQHSKGAKNQPREAKVRGGKIGGKIGGKKHIGMHWFNNGVKQTYTFDCPGPGWVKGMLRRKKI